MQLRRHCFILIIGAISICLTSCIKKSASDREDRSDADLLFSQPTLQDYKQMERLEGYSNAQTVFKRSRADSLTPLEPSTRDEYRDTLLLDVPLPVDARALAGHADCITQRGLCLARSTSLQQSALVDFYLSMLESAGWSLSGQVQSSEEWLMVWEKPRKLCVVSLRPVHTRSLFGKKSTSTCIVITIGDKNLH